MADEKQAPNEPVRTERAPERPVYEPPRLTKKRSVSRATLFTGTGPDSGGLPGAAPPGSLFDELSKGNRR